jgi:membrane-bound lytic murein transglycosylase D
MAMLARYQDQFHDWRVTDYAYNAGEFAVRRLIARHGLPPTEPAIPALPVRNVTREHLVKLLAIACVVRHPDQFNVTLPTLPEDQHLVAVPIDRAMSMSKAAEHAGMSVDVLRSYNAAFLNNRIDPDLADTLLLPGARANQFQAAVQASVQSPDTSASTSEQPHSHAQTHVVRSGESLWGIARTYDITVAKLRRWNALVGNVVRPGQVLVVSKDL